MKEEKGFTLLEVVLALSILATVMILLTSSWRGNYQRMTKIKFRTQAAYLLQMKMTEFESLYKANPATLPTEIEKGEFKDPAFKNYTWELESQPFKMPDLKKLLALENDKTDQITENVIGQVQTHFESTIYEVKVTLLYRSALAKKPFKTSISTLFVDYNRPLQLGLPPL